MLVAVLAVAALVTAATSDNGASIFVAPGTAGLALTRLLEEEVGRQALAPSAAQADLLISLSEEGDLLRFQCRSADGEVLLERAIDTEVGLAAALRVAVVLSQEARARFAVAVPPTPTAAPFHLGRGLSAGPSFGFFARPLTPQFGAQLVVDLDLELLRLALGLRLGGLGCCSPETAQLSSSITAVAVLLQAEPRLFALGPLELLATLGAGVAVDGGTARPKVFQGATPAQAVSGVGLSGRLGLRLELPLSARFSVLLGGGIELYAARLSVALPGPFASNAAPFEGGPLSPWTDLSLRWAVF